MVEEVTDDAALKSKDHAYLALGDSYTIGESVDENERWPVLLAERARADSVIVSDPLIIATTGWTTDELMKGIEEKAITGQTFDFVSLLIGVNNQYRGYNIDTYKKEFELLLNDAIAFASGETSNVFVVSIPDYGVTPFAADRDSDLIFREISAYNEIAENIARSKGIAFLNITDISRDALSDSELVAKDGLHPSGKMYKRWIDEVIYPWFVTKIKS